NYYVDEKTLSQLNENGQIAFTYKDENDNGSTEKIAGVLNEQGNVLGILPLPERAIEEIIGGTDGLPLFKSILKRWNENNVSQS
ncbi:phosphoribosylformylglycinamidine synthase subunit PurQ, partial [Microvirga sp. 3-52]|nr:phosphoribosylformylglycinamidine synthase subunit PurQ [Microvirga sp. 3-52]